MTKIELYGVSQDGASFFAERDTPHAPMGNCIACYPALVVSDFDTEGAERARERFALDYPIYTRKPLDRDDIWRCIEPDRDNAGDATRLDARATVHAAADWIAEGYTAEEVAAAVLNEFNDDELHELSLVCEDWGNTATGDGIDPVGPVARLVVALEGADKASGAIWMAWKPFGTNEVIELVRRHDALVAALRDAEAFMSGFEDDELQEGVNTKLATMRKLLGMEGGAA